jgi:phosphopentomutase
MSINLGTAGLEAIKNMRNSPHWEEFMLAFENATRQVLHNALSSDSAHRVDQTGYARALSDVHSALTAVTKDLNPRQVTKLTAKSLATADA